MACQCANFVEVEKNKENNRNSEKVTNSSAANKHFSRSPTTMMVEESSGIDAEKYRDETLKNF